MVYKLEISVDNESEPNDKIEEADLIGVGYDNAVISAKISSETDVDYYKFVTTANRTYIIETFNISANTLNDATVLYLYDANGNQLALDEHGSNGTNDANASITHTFIESGTYYV
ncbi:MAG: hypothetical protein GY749_39540, partial [Desulfobacteraceae bacterium]|nr:hypothetical protein [Desulfobacteraceae bacterium]